MTRKKEARPGALRAAEMERRGYGTAAEVALAHDVSASSVYGWARRWIADGHMVTVPGADAKKAAAVWVGAHLFVLHEAVRQRMAIPAEAGS